MIVPNYIPDPLEIPANVTEESYGVRLVFIRRVTALLILSAGLVGLATNLPWPRIGVVTAFGVLSSTLILLDLWRIFARGTPSEARVSAAILPIVLTAVAWNLREIQLHGWPIWQLLLAPVSMGVYTLLCGRDYSFVGNFFLSLIASTILTAETAHHLGLDGRHATFAILTNLALLAYLVYDLASLLSRRRVREEWAAVVDLYRDIFNFPGYLLRVVRHWRKHKLLAMPSPFEIHRKV